MGTERMITIGRQFGAGGRSLGRKLSERLGVSYYDKELITKAAEAAGISEKFVSGVDEIPAGSLLFAIAMNAQTGRLFQGGKPMEQVVYEAQVAAIRNVAEKGSCVIVGRAADCILRPAYDVISIFVSAPVEIRIKRVAERDNISDKDAKDKINRLDHARASYYNSFSDRIWGAASSYDICLDSSKISMDYAAEWLADYISHR